ncbi:MAG: endolytic transglycosylase MltG [bacterium]
MLSLRTQKIIRTSLAVVIISLIVLGLLYIRLPKTNVHIDVPPGSTALHVTDILSKEGLIISRSFFMAYLEMTGGIHKIKAGNYNFSPRSLTPAIAQALVRGKTVMTRLTIPEGLTKEQTAAHLAAKGFGSEEKYRQLFDQENLEGYLFPETYVISPGLTEIQIVEIITKQFAKTFNEQWKKRAEEISLSVREAVILASIIEKEAKTAHERPLISAVFHNRLHAPKYLESCATIQYALGTWKKRLSLKDLQIDSPYNTYKHFGLPPGPICSPGRASLQAALYPADSDAVFFIANGDGTHTFTKQYKDHVKEKKEYKKMIKEYRRRQNSPAFTNEIKLQKPPESKQTDEEMMEKEEE